MSADQAPTGATAGHLEGQVRGRVHGQAHRAGYDAETRARLAAESAQIMARYPQQRSALLPMLRLVQAEDGYVSPRGIAFCAQDLGISTAEVSAVATFYTQYKRRPNGEYTVGVCTNTLCAVMGGDAIWEELSDHLGVGNDETTADGAITLERVECNAACDYAPVVMVNWEFFDNQTPASAVETVDRLRADLPGSAVVGGAAVENLDLKTQLDDSTPLVIGVILALGFLLLLFALQAPLIALLGTLASLLSTAAAFGVARLVFQDGIGSGLFGFESQGFLDAWAPVFFFAMIFAIAMDYTVFLLASAKEHYEHSKDPREAMIGAVAHSGRVIFAAGAVMVAVFFTFSLSGPLPPKEMGIILGIAVLLDTFLIRLVLLPVLLRLTGKAAWYVPAWLGRILPDIKFAHD